MTVEIIAPHEMTPGERRHLGALEKRIAAGLQTFREVGSALLEIRESRLYRETHATFEAYCSDRWALDRSRAYQLMSAAQVVKVLGDPVVLHNEAQARELYSLAADSPEVAKQVWAAVETKAEETGKPVTAAMIREVKASVLQPEGPAPVSQTDRLVQDMTRLGNTYARWRDSRPSKQETSLVKAAKQKLTDALNT